MAKVTRKPGPLTDAEKRRIRKLIADGTTHRGIMDATGVANSTLVRFKKAEGLTTPVVHPAQAIGSAGNQRNAALKRAERTAALDELYEARAKMLREVTAGRAQYRTVLKGAMGVETVETIDIIPPSDWRYEVGSLASIAQAIDRNDDRADDGGLARAQSMLAKVLEAVSGAKITAPEGVINR